MRIQKKSRILALILALLMLLCACGGNTQTPASSVTEPNTPADTDAPPVSAPVEEPSDVPPSEETPTPSEEIPRFYEANGLSYPSALGKPVLGESAAALVSSVAQSEASKQITNVGDAIWYLRSAGKFDDPSEACDLFASLIARDYDEVGFIMLRCPGNGGRLVYILQDGIYYIFDPSALADGYSGWFYGRGSACAEGEDLDAICEEVMATWPDGGADLSKRSYSVEKRYSRLTEQEEELFAYLTTPQYTKEQIEQWAAEGLTLSQWAEKIRVPADALQMLEALGYRSLLYNDNVCFNGPNGAEWGGIWNAQTVFEHRSGGCGGTSNLMNFLLSGDFDEQGYVEYNGNYGGHIFNYFLSDGIYVMCDFVGLFAGERLDIDEGTEAYVVFIGGDLHRFKEEYMNLSYHNDPGDTEYIYQLFMYPRDGTKLPKGSDEDSYPTQFDNWVWDLLPQQYQDSYTILFEREGYPIRFVPISDPNTWPAEVRTETNAPADTDAPPVSAPVEEPSDVPPSEETPAPSEETPTPSEETPRFYEVNGLSYPSALGKPVLGESAADLVSSVSQSEASKQITNVGDAIWYLRSAGKFDDPSDACTLFASLIARDYDEVGFIMLRCPGNAHRLTYILQDGMYYLLNPGALAAGYSGWFCGHGRACTEGEDLDAICQEAMATWPDGGADLSKRSYSVEKSYSRLTEQEEELFAYLTTPQYTKEQIDQWAAEGLTLEQWAEKIKVPADAIQMLEALGYSSMLYPTSSPFDGPNGTHWGADWNAKTVFEHRSGKCGGTSNLMNALLSGDFDEQGYVEYNSNYGGHVFNYFLSDGIYVMCDFVGLFAEERVYIDEGTDAYVIFVGGDLNKFKEEYMTIKGHNDPEDTEYILQLFMHPNEGANLPKGYDKNSSHSSFDSVVWDLLPQQYQDSYTILFEREGYPIRFVPISDPNTWPEETQ